MWRKQLDVTPCRSCGRRGWWCRFQGTVWALDSHVSFSRKLTRRKHHWVSGSRQRTPSSQALHYGIVTDAGELSLGETQRIEPVGLGEIDS